MSLPTISSNKNAISSGVRAKHPGVVRTGIFLSLLLSTEIKPGVGLYPYILAYAAGPLHDPI